MTHICTCPGSLASSLESSIKRNQLAGASCKSCGGRFLVDGIGPLSRSMLGTVGLEVTNSINCELSWKTVKGKRSRKSVARNNGRVTLGNKSPKRVGDFSGSDSDKFGEPGTGQCFPDKAEYVPIKKRRYYLRSPSPSLRTSLYSGQSVSPQLRTPSSHSDDLEHLSDHNGSSGSYTNRRGFVAARVGNGVNEGVVSDKVSEETSGELYNSDNFSGIALLAAAACNNNIDDDPYEGKGDAVEISSLPQRSDASTSSLPVRECIPCSESGKQMDKDASLLDNKEGCSLVVESSHGAPSSSEENEEGKSASSKIDRRHWDLNTLMDAWEQPNEDTSAQYKCDDTCIDGMPMEKLDKEGCVIQGDCISNGSGSESCLPLDHIESASQSSTAKMKENGSEEFCQTSYSSLSGHSMEPVKYSLADEKVSSHVLGSNGSFTNCPLSESCHSSEVSGGNLDIKSCPVSAMIPGADSCRDASSLATTSEQNVVLPDASDLEKFGGENDGQLRDPEDSEKKTELPDNRIALGLEKCIGTCKTLDAENLESISGENTLPSSKCEGLSISDISVGGHSTVISDAKGQDGKILAANDLGTDAARCLGFKQLPSKDDDPHVRDEEGEGRSILQDSGKGFVLNDCHNSDVSQDDPGCINGRDKIDDLQAGYDSPYEDGELRGSVLYSWEENELEDGENECLDYDSDGRVSEDSDIGDSPSSKVVEAGSEGSQGKEKKGLLGAQSQETDSRRSTSVKSSSRGESKGIREKIETAGKKVSNQGSGTTEELSTDVIVERNYGSRRGRTSDHMDGLDVKGSYAGVGSKTTRGKLQSRIEGPSTLDAMERDNVYTLQGRSRNSGSSYSRENRDGCPDRYVTRYRPAAQERERNGGNNQLVYWDSRSRYPSSYRGHEGQVPNRQRSSINDPVDKFGGVNSHDHKQSMNYSSRTERDSSPDRFATRYRSAVHERERIGGDGHLFYWESRNRYPSSYRGPEGQGQPRPRSVIADSVDKFGGLDPHDHKQSVNYSSKSMQRPLGWRRSPVDRDEYPGSQRRVAAFSSNRNRGGSRNFTDGVGRGPRGEYHQPMDDDAASSVRMPHYLSWKERGFFAPSTKGVHASVPRRDSRSRSRTRSPRAWHPQRERNLGARRHSRSPDFRSEARMDRMRAPFQKPNFAADYGESFMSPPRGRFSPQRNFRGLDDGNFVDSHLRHRRSPLNVFRQSQRLESIGLSGRLKSDDSFRPMMRPGRFPHTAGLGRGCKLEENDDDKRHDDRSGMMH